MVLFSSTHIVIFFYTLYAVYCLCKVKPSARFPYTCFSGKSTILSSFCLFFAENNYFQTFQFLDIIRNTRLNLSKRVSSWKLQGVFMPIGHQNIKHWKNNFALPNGVDEKSSQQKKWKRDWYEFFFWEGSLSCFLRSLFSPLSFFLHSKVQSLLWKPMNLVRLMATLEKWSVHRMFYKLLGLGFSLTIVWRQAS